MTTRFLCVAFLFLCLNEQTLRIAAVEFVGSGDGSSVCDWIGVVFDVMSPKDCHCNSIGLCLFQTLVRRSGN